MIKLSKEEFSKATNFVKETARPLDQKLFEYYFENGTTGNVLSELAKFQNKDGGFGNSIEPDFRLDISSPLATTIGLQFARELKLPSDNPVVKRAIQYLLETFDNNKNTWHSVPKEVNEVPHAPWWNYDVEKGYCGSNPTWANPNAEIIGYLHEYAELVPSDFLQFVTELAIKELHQMPDTIEMHDFFCYQRLMEVVPNPHKEIIFQKLRKSVRLTTVLNSNEWGGYGARPLQIVSSPQSPFFDLLLEEINLNLEYEIKVISNDGSWNPNWSWFGQYEEDWKYAEKDWQGYLTVKTLKSLNDFGRIETF